MGIKVNLAGVESGFKPIPAGTYICQVADGNIKQSGPEAKHPGEDYIEWKLEVTQGDHKGRQFFFNTSLIPDYLWNLKALLECSPKFTPEQLEREDFDFEIEDVVGTQLKAVIVMKKYQGEDRNEVKRVKPLGVEEQVEESLLP